MAILISLIGTNLGFIKHNFFPAKIFMGDGGSFFLGSIIAFFSLNQNLFSSSYDVNISYMISKFLIVGLPLIDMVNVLFNRVLKKKVTFLSDRFHFHYKLIDSGISHINSSIYLLFSWFIFVINRFIFCKNVKKLL